MIITQQEANEDRYIAWLLHETEEATELSAKTN